MFSKNVARYFEMLESQIQNLLLLSRIEYDGCTRGGPCATPAYAAILSFFTIVKFYLFINGQKSIEKY